MQMNVRHKPSISRDMHTCDTSVPSQSHHHSGTDVRDRASTALDLVPPCCRYPNSIEQLFNRHARSRPLFLGRTPGAAITKMVHSRISEHFIVCVFLCFTVVRVYRPMLVEPGLNSPRYLVFWVVFICIHVDSERSEPSE